MEIKVKDLIRVIGETVQMEIFADDEEYICTPATICQKHLDFIVTYIGCGPAFCNISKCDPTKMLLIDCQEEK